MEITRYVRRVGAPGRLFIFTRFLFAETYKTMVIAISVVVGFILLCFFIFGWGVSVYNGLVKYRNRYKNAYSQIDVQLIRRNDLIPNLVETAKGFMKHESQTLEAVIRARYAAVGANQQAAANPGDRVSMEKLNAAEGTLAGALGRLLIIFESYPDLKANRNIMAIQEELTSTENKISFARQHYNDSVTLYNTNRELFPSNIIAGLFNFSEAALFEISDPAQREAPKVSF